jgi:hypothetical protein
MQNAVSFLEIPLPLFTCLVWEVFLQEIKEINSLLVQLWKVCLGDTGLARGDVPVHALNQYLHNIVTGISNMRQAVQTGAGLGVINCGVDEFDLAYTPSLISVYVPVYTGVCRCIPRLMYLRGDEVTNHERQGEHEHLHTITCHLGILLVINVNVVEVGSIRR